MEGRALDWDAVRVFLAVARAGSLRRGAETLSVTHATARRAVDTLEATLGARFFERSHSGLQLTQAGEDLLASAERMETEAASIGRRLAGRDMRPAGPVRVSAPPSLVLTLLAEPLAAFARAYPEIELRLDLSNRFLDLARHEADVSIRVAYEVDGEMLGRRAVRYCKAVYGAPGYFAARPGLTPGDGAEAEWLGFVPTAGPPKWVAASPFPNARVAHVISDSAMHVEAAAQGMGMASLPCFMGDADPRLVRAPGVAPVEDRSIWLLLHPDLRQVARVRAFVDFMARAIRERRPLLRGERPRPGAADQSGATDPEASASAM